MKRVVRLLLFAIALAVGGVLGYVLLSGFEPLGYAIWMIACALLGRIFHQIDKWICGHY